MVEVGWIARITSSAGFEDLLQPPYNAGQYKDMIIPFKWTQGLTTDGRLVAMPKDIAPATVFYRKDIFEAAGLPSEPEEVQKAVLLLGGLCGCSTAAQNGIQTVTDIRITGCWQTLVKS